jgi:hypothetical protein
MKYFKLLLDDDGCEDDIVCYHKEMYGIGQYDVLKGRMLSHWDERVALFYDPIKGNIPTDYLANSLGWFLISINFKSILEHLDPDIEYKPISIINQNDKRFLMEYYVANILDLVDALDLSQSDYSVYEAKGKKITAIRKYALNKNKLEGKNIFKLVGDEIPIFVSEKFKNIVEANGITGCDFLEVKTV